MTQLLCKTWATLFYCFCTNMAVLSRDCIQRIDHLTVLCSVTRPLNKSEAWVDLALIQTSLLFLCKSCCCNANEYIWSALSISRGWFIPNLPRRPKIVDTVLRWFVEYCETLRVRETGIHNFGGVGGRSKWLIQNAFEGTLPRKKNGRVSSLNHLFFPVAAPHPSTKCQRLFGQLCVKDNQLANEFLNGLLNQLNWSFSEFIGMLQEVRRVLRSLYT